MTGSDTEQGPSTFEARLLDELRPLHAAQRARLRRGDATPDRRPPRRATVIGRIAVAAALAVALVVASNVVGLVGGSPDPAFAVEVLDDGRVHLVLRNDRAYPVAQAEAQLQAAGIDVRVESVPGSRSTVPRLVGIGLDHDAPGVDVANGWRGVGGAPDEIFDAVVDPARFDGTVVLQVVPRATSLEPRDAVFSAFSPGEVLEDLPCEQGWPLTSRQVAEGAEAAGLQVQWWRVTGLPDDERGYAFEPRAERPEGVVVHAWEGPISEPGIVEIPADTLAVQVLPGTPDTEQEQTLGLDPEPYLRYCPGR